MQRSFSFESRLAELGSALDRIDFASNDPGVPSEGDLFASSDELHQDHSPPVLLGNLGEGPIATLLLVTTPSRAATGKSRTVRPA